MVARGRVQGVFFRASLQRLAQERGVSGFARNRPDGSVEAVFEGPADAVEALIAYAADGPRDADVSHLDVTEEEPEGLSGFETH